jgi:hypothetical protein
MSNVQSSSITLFYDSQIFFILGVGDSNCFNRLKTDDHLCFGTTQRDRLHTTTDTGITIIPL